MQMIRKRARHELNRRPRQKALTRSSHTSPHRTRSGSWESRRRTSPPSHRALSRTRTAAAMPRRPVHPIVAHFQIARREAARIDISMSPQAVRLGPDRLVHQAARNFHSRPIQPRDHEEAIRRMKRGGIRAQVKRTDDRAGDAEIFPRCSATARDRHRRPLRCARATAPGFYPCLLP